MHYFRTKIVIFLTSIFSASSICGTDKGGCADALSGYIFENREQNLTAIEELRGILSSLKQIGAGTEAKLRGFEKTLTHYNQFESDIKDRFEVVSEILTLLGAADPHTFMAFSGVLESEGFLYYTTDEIIRGDIAKKTPAINSKHTLVVNDTKYVSQIVKLMESNKLLEQMRKWNISAIQLVSLDSRLTLFPIVKERGSKTLEMLSIWRGRHYSRTNGGHSESEKENYLIDYVLAPYAQFATEKGKTLGIHLESILSSEEIDETVQALLSLLGYRIEPHAPRSLYWIQDSNNVPSVTAKQKVGKKALAMFRMLSELKLSVTTYKSFLSGPKSQLEKGASLQNDTDLFEGGQSGYFKPVVPSEKYLLAKATFNIHCHPLVRNRAVVDGVAVPWGIEAGIKYLEENGYKYDAQADRWFRF